MCSNNVTSNMADSTKILLSISKSFRTDSKEREKSQARTGLTDLSRYASSKRQLKTPSPPPQSSYPNQHS